MRRRVGQDSRTARGKDLFVLFVFHDEHGICHLSAQGGHVDFIVELTGVEDHEMGHIDLTTFKDGC
jgi:hypothetical protein